MQNKDLGDLCTFPICLPMSDLFDTLNKKNYLIYECWGIIFKTEFILKEDLSFSDARVGEDTSFVTSCLASAQNWSYTNKYCITKSTSIGLSRKFNYKNGLSLISSLSYLIYYFKSRSTLSTDALQYLVRIELLYAREIGIYIVDIPKNS